MYSINELTIQVANYFAYKIYLHKILCILDIITFYFLLNLKQYLLPSIKKYSRYLNNFVPFQQCTIFRKILLF